MFNWGYRSKLRRMKKNFLSVIVVPQDGSLIKNSLNGQPVDVFDMGTVAMIPIGAMQEVLKRTEADDEVPFRIFYILVSRDVQDPVPVKNAVMDTLKGVLSYRWLYGDKMLHELEA